MFGSSDGKQHLDGYDFDDGDGDDDEVEDDDVEVEDDDVEVEDDEDDCIRATWRPKQTNKPEMACLPAKCYPKEQPFPLLYAAASFAKANPDDWHAVCLGYVASALDRPWLPHRFFPFRL